MYYTLCSVTAYRILYCTHVTKYCPVTSLHYVTTWYCLYFLDLAFPCVEPVAWSGLQCPLLSVSGSIPPTLHTCTHSYYRHIHTTVTCHYHAVSLLLALVLVELQVTLTKNWTEKLLERPSICYIFEKLKVQGCQIWHSHVSTLFTSAAAHSAYPHNAKKALYVIISCEIPEN